MLTEMPAAVQELSRDDKLRLMEMLAEDLARPHRLAEPPGRPVSFADFGFDGLARAEGDAPAEGPSNTTPHSPQTERRLLDESANGGPCEVWSPWDASAAAAELQKLLTPDGERP